MGIITWGTWKRRFSIWERMKRDNVEATVVTFNSLLGGLCREKRMEEAKKVLDEMEACGFVPES